MDFNSYSEAVATAKRLNADADMIQRVTHGISVQQVWHVLVVKDERFIVWNGEGE